MHHKKLLKLRILTPEKVVYNGEVSVISLPGGEGNLSVLFGHEKLTANLCSGTIVFCARNLEQVERVKISGGVMNAEFDQCVVITTKAKLIG
ncbi:MAG: hypothetical protein HRK26_00105 [Rickettsiaceae bacterium H1]|nr:hypothetical protein [Rickettsiaceae bacterium H1]